MLLHRPLGLGHPYRLEPDQRIPVNPVSGEEWRVRVRTDAKTSEVLLFMLRGTEAETYSLTLRGEAQSDDPGPYGVTAKYTGGNTHLADAAARSGEYPGELEWEIQLPPLDEYEVASYWFENNNNERSDSFAVHSLLWVPDQSGFVKATYSSPLNVELSDAQILVDSERNIFKVRASLPFGANDHVVGFGERFHSVDQRGNFVDAVVYEEYKGQGHRTYLPAPFGIVVGSDYGFYINTSAPSRFDVGVTERNKILIEIDIAPGQAECEIKLYSGKPISILKQYMSEFGLPENPPHWIYSLWASSNEWNTQERLQYELAQSRAHAIDVGVVVIEAWSDESTFMVFRDGQYTPNDGSMGLSAKEISYPPSGAWPNPREMIEDLHKNDTKIVLWQIPVIKDEGEPGSQISAVWNYAIENDFVVREANGDPYRIRGFWFRDGILPDLTDSKVRQWWGALHRYLVEDLGVDGFKTDGGEHAWGNDLRYLGDGLGITKNNLFPVAYAQTFHELFASSNREGITFSRAGFAGSSSFPTFWAGDEDSTWDAFRASIRAGISASASGIFFWGWDIGGFSGPIPTAELYLRGTAMATFCPIMQFHSEFNHHREPSNDRSPWNIATQTERPEVIEIFREFSNVRKRLQNYLAREGEVAIATGRPLMAGLFFDYPEDAEIWRAQYQYMLGRYLLIAPVTEEDRDTSDVYLPLGRWLDFWNRETTYEGGQWITLDAPLDRIPVFIREDAPFDVTTL